MMAYLPGLRRLATATLLLAASPGDAATLVGVEALQSWNLVVFGNVRSTSSVEGRSFIGGSLAVDKASFFEDSGGGKSGDGVVKSADSKETELKEAEEYGFVEDRGKDPQGEAPKPGSSLPGLVVAGSVGGRELRLGSGAAIGGSVDAQFRVDEGQIVEIGGSAVKQDDKDGDYRTELGGDFTATLIREGAALRESLTSLSDNLKALKNTGDIVGGDTLTIKAGEGPNVFSLSLDMFREAKDISVTAADGSTIVINVSGKSGSIDSHFINDLKDIGQNIVWNFYEASDLVFDSAFFGAVLAPGALVTSNDYLEGTLVARNYVQNDELHSNAFQGDLSAPRAGEGGTSGGGGIVSATPEPATWAMLILGFGLIGVTLRRRSRRALLVQAI